MFTNVRYIVDFSVLPSFDYTDVLLMLYWIKVLSTLSNMHFEFDKMSLHHFLGTLIYIYILLNNKYIHMQFFHLLIKKK